MSDSPKVLVVDDTPANVKLLADLLAAKGFGVATAANGEEALAQVAKATPDIVLLDVMMPGMSGYDVCRRIRGEPATALHPRRPSPPSSRLRWQHPASRNGERRC